jgi:hypothetical protein
MNEIVMMRWCDISAIECRLVIGCDCWCDTGYELILTSSEYHLLLLLPLLFNSSWSSCCTYVWRRSSLTTYYDYVIDDNSAVECRLVIGCDCWCDTASSSVTRLATDYQWVTLIPVSPEWVTLLQADEISLWC